MRIPELSLSLVISLILFSSCDERTPIGTEAITQEIASFEGLWRQIGYGRILELNDSTLKVFDLNEVHCMLTFEEEILDFAEIIGVSNDTLLLQHGIDRWKCLKIESLPEFCSTESRELDGDPVHNFEMFWQNFKEHYCSFDIKNMDWEKVREEYKPRITARTTDLELYTVFMELIDKLDDGHVKISAPDTIEDEYKTSIKQEPKKYGMLDMFSTGKDIAAMYVDSLRSFNAGMTRWGMIDKYVGYVQINSMLMQADYGLEEGLSLMEFEKPYWVDNVSQHKDEIHRKQEAAGMKKTLGRILKDLSSAKSFILDLRFNGGGKDGVAMEIVSHFSALKGTVASKAVYENGQLVNPQDIVNTPSSVGFSGPVYLLTSHETASASELVVLCSLADGQFTRIGSNTEGIFSSTLDKELPNGWKYEFSNEVYTDLRGKNHEHIGIAPDINIDYPQKRDSFLDILLNGIKAGSDPAIEASLKMAK